MNTATLGRDPFIPKPPRVRGRAFTLAVLAHLLLILALAFAVHWRSSQPVPMSAELWSAVPQVAAPRAVASPPAATKPAPLPKPEPVAPPPKPPAPVARPDPQIAIEQAKREEAQRARAEQERQEQIRREKAQKAERDKAEQRAKEEQAQQKAAAEKAEREKAEREKAEKAEAARLAALRDAQIKRMQGLAGATGAPGSTGTAARSSGPSSSYAGRIVARIKPNILFTDTIDGNPVATVEVKLAPDGTVIARRLVKSSGVKTWDDAVLRAIDRTEMLPRDVDGRVPPSLQIEFRPRD